MQVLRHGYEISTPSWYNDPKGNAWRGQPSVVISMDRGGWVAWGALTSALVDILNRKGSKTIRKYGQYRDPRKVEHNQFRWVDLPGGEQYERDTEWKRRLYSG